jgi:hypothetical protein
MRCWGTSYVGVLVTYIIVPDKPPLIEQELFDKCQEVRARRANKRRALGAQKQIYILAGLARCDKCGLTMRCGATSSGQRFRYYRHMPATRGYECVVPSKSIRADLLEEQLSELIGDIHLPDAWRHRIEELAGNTDQREAVLREREQLQERLRRLKQMYRDLVLDDTEYRRTLEDLQSRMAGLVLPNNPHIVRAGEYLETLGPLWREATLAEQRDIARVLFKAVYLDVEAGYIVAIEPVAIFRPLFIEFCTDLGVEIR